MLSGCIRGWSTSPVLIQTNTIVTIIASSSHLPLSVPFAMSFRCLFAAACLLRTALAHPSTSKHHSHHLLSSRDACSGNTASTRSEWCDYSIDTDYMTEVPDTGVTREYWLTLDDVTVAPDGVSRSAMAVNGYAACNLQGA